MTPFSWLHAVPEGTHGQRLSSLAAPPSTAWSMGGAESF
jgi:hypothetical protein